LFPVGSVIHITKLHTVWYISEQDLLFCGYRCLW
jgi:hypothetical protein